ncbi:MAG: esterase-like activity of phytase family protein, partial [Crocinitomicaceae bacterium]
LTFISNKANSQITLNKIATYHTGIFDGGGTEIVSYDPTTMRLFSVNADAQSVDIINLADPSNPTLISQIDITPYGAGANSVKVKNGVVAAAVEANVKQDPGKIVLFQTDGTFIAEYPAGALPDMITFDHSGDLIITANEGEPSDDYMNDPEGSITILDISAGAASGTVTQVSFNAYDNRKEHLINKGIRIFGPNATVSKDMEPEYVTVLDNDTIAYVVCQENNAMVVLNLNSKSIMDIYALGVKDHNHGLPSVNNIILNQAVTMPALGTPVYGGGQPTVNLGGFSGLFYDAANSTTTDWVFYAIPDRGPNADAVSKSTVTPTPSGNLRPFKLPDYQSRIVKFHYNPTTQAVTLNAGDQIMLFQANGTTPISGKGNINGFDEVPVAYYDAATIYNTVDYTDGNGVEYTALPYDRFGGDFEGIVRDNNGNFWMCDEYRPAIYKFAANGNMIDRFVPSGAHQLANPATAADTLGHYGSETLPAVYNKRWANRGFEAIAYDASNNLIYAFIQSPMFNPGSVTKDQSDVIRILAINPATGAPVAEYVYLLERNKDAGYSLNRTDKIGDAVYVGNGKFYVLERDSSDPNTTLKGKKYVYEICIDGATDILPLPISSLTDTTGGALTLEMMTADQLIANNIRPVFKRKMLNLPSAGYISSDKPEGIAYINDSTIAVVNDNDFGLAGAGVTDNTVLGIVNLGSNNAIDASNTDGNINITNWPTFGFYMPDAITNFTDANGETFILTANEGDARDYGGYSEEERVKDLTLNTTYFPNASTLQQNDNLGRLNSTLAQGDINNDGENEYVFSYGARSFSIRDIYGNLVWDSGDDFAHQVAANYPAQFNSNNDDNDSFDSRSDDKGTEPEAVTVAKIDGNNYAFIGLERMGGIMVYDIDDVNNPSFVLYELNRNFNVPADSINSSNEMVTGDLAPEDLIVISETESPTIYPYLISANEVSGTITIYQINYPGLGEKENVLANETFTVYPNPNKDGNLYVSKFGTYKVYDMFGKMVKTVANTKLVNVSELTPGVYFLNDSNNQSVKFIKY